MRPAASSAAGDGPQGLGARDGERLLPGVAARSSASRCSGRRPSSSEAERFPEPAKANHGSYHQKQDTRRAQAEPPQVLEERQVPAEGAVGPIVKVESSHRHWTKVH